MMRRAALTPFGVELYGVQIASVTTARADEFRELIAESRVVVFRDQRIDDEGLVSFLRNLGELTFTEGEVPVDGAPHLNVVSNIGRTTPPRSVFHTDTSYAPQPPAFTALRSVLLPEVGGATLFSDQVAAARDLPATARAWLEGRSVLHIKTGLNGRDEQSRHPILRRHPVTGDVALFLSTPERCSGLSGVDPSASARIIDLLYRRSIRPSRLYRHEWRSNDVVIWDDRLTMHRADHQGVAGDRVLHRGMVAGETPIAA